MEALNSPTRPSFRAIWRNNFPSMDSSLCGLSSSTTTSSPQVSASPHFFFFFFYFFFSIAHFLIYLECSLFTSPKATTDNTTTTTHVSLYSPYSNIKINKQLQIITGGDRKGTGWRHKFFVFLAFLPFSNTEKKKKRKKKKRMWYGEKMRCG